LLARAGLAQTTPAHFGRSEVHRRMKDGFKLCSSFVHSSAYCIREIPPPKRTSVSPARANLLLFLETIPSGPRIAVFGALEDARDVAHVTPCQIAD